MVTSAGPRGAHAGAERKPAIGFDVGHMPRTLRTGVERSAPVVEQKPQKTEERQPPLKRPRDARTGGAIHTLSPCVGEERAPPLSGCCAHTRGSLKARFAAEVRLANLRMAAAQTFLAGAALSSTAPAS